MSPTDYKYEPLVTNGPLQSAAERIPDEFFEKLGNLSDAHDIIDGILKRVAVDPVQFEAPGMAQASQALLISTGAVLDNRTTLLMNAITALTQLMDPSNYLDPTFGD